MLGNIISQNYLPISIPSTFHRSLRPGAHPSLGNSCFGGGVANHGGKEESGVWASLLWAGHGKTEQGKRWRNTLILLQGIVTALGQDVYSEGGRGRSGPLGGWENTSRVLLSTQTQPVVARDCLWHVCLESNLSVPQDAQCAPRPIKAGYQWTTQDFYSNPERLGWSTDALEGSTH